jgi:3',5'-cyclic AMP phosphodiesterase CpdA
MSSTTIAQITDTHIRELGRLAYGKLDTSVYLAQAVAAIGQLKQRPDAVVVTGDLTDFGRPAEYVHLAQLLAPLSQPVYLLPGNHDDRQELRRSFPGHGYLGTTGFVQYSVYIGKLRILALDTVEAGESGGRLCERRLEWLRARLHEDARTPTIVAMHHPPFKSLIGHMDRIGLLEGGDRLAALLRDYGNVERVICGHLHRPIFCRFGGTVASTAPSPAHQVCLDLAEDAPSAWALEPPAMHIHAWSATSGLLTHLAPIGVFDGPHPFHENGTLID